MTGSGKSYFCNFLLQNAQKYAPLTFIFDIGGSFQSLTTIFGGSYLNVGQEARDFTINPFSLPQTKENMQFLFSFFRVLIEGNEQRYRIDFKEERKLWNAIERVYVLEVCVLSVAKRHGAFIVDTAAGSTICPGKAFQCGSSFASDGSFVIRKTVVIIYSRNACRRL
jgi:hypothetical protein